MRFRNDSGETIPAFAAVRITGVEIRQGNTILVGSKPDGGSEPVLINGHTPVAADAIGETQDGTIVAAYFEESESPAVGDSLGATDDEWKLSSGGSGWVFLGAIGASKTALFRVEGGGGLTAAIADSPIAPGATEDVFLADSDFEATETTVEATNDSGVSISSGTKLYLGRVRPLSGWRIVQAFVCEDE